MKKSLIALVGAALAVVLAVPAVALAMRPADAPSALAPLVSAPCAAAAGACPAPCEEAKDLRACPDAGVCAYPRADALCPDEGCPGFIDVDGDGVCDHRGAAQDDAGASCSATSCPAPAGDGWCDRGAAAGHGMPHDCGREAAHGHGCRR